MNQNLKPIYQRAYNALVERLGNSGIGQSLQAGTAPLRPVVYYFRRQLATSTTKYLQDWSQSRLTGITNLEKGKFPYKMTAAFSHVDIAYGYSATNVAANTIKYYNTLYVPSLTDELTVNTRNYAVEKDIVPTDLVNSELTVALGDITVYDRTPMAGFFKQARYQTDRQAKGGFLSIENAIELTEAVTVTDANEPNVEINWNSGATIGNYGYIQFALFGLEIAVK